MNQDKDISNQFNAARPYTAWTLLKAYWQSAERFYAYIFLIFGIIMTIALVGFDVIFNYWHNYFYTALQQYDRQGISRLIVTFIFLATVYIILAVYRFYISQIFAVRWRKWLTDQLINRWLSYRAYYLIENFDSQTDNPDQRIQEDIASIVTYSIDLFLGLISAITTFFAFIYILWKLSGDFVLPLGSLGNFHIPGYLVWVGILYASLGTLFTFKIGRPLISLNFEQQRREATFRYAAVDLRSHAENIALYEGEHHQKGVLSHLFGSVLQNWYAIIRRQKKLMWFTAGYTQTALILPVIAALPNYFNKVFLLGGLIQTIQAFNNIRESLSFLVNSYNQIAQWQATSNRLTSFINHMNTIEQDAKKANHLSITEQKDNRIIINQLTCQTPQLKTLLNNINQVFIHGKNYLIQGPSGIGKSTLIRTIAGIWPYASGEIILPAHQKIMYLSQKPYMPIGTLSQALLFPDGQFHSFQARLQEVLHLCRLSHLVNQLDETARWGEKLSPGEQQRIAFARILIHQPDWVFLDESTSMLDLENEAKLYAVLQSELPQCSIISIGHRPSVGAFHDQIIDFAGNN